MPDPQVPRAASPPEALPAGPVTLRSFAGDEGPGLYRLVLRNHAHLRPWMPWAGATPTEEANTQYVRLTVDERNRGAAFGYWLQENSTGEMVGCAGLHGRIGPGALEIGYWVSADRTRRGYATESARALTTAAFGLPDVARVEIHCDEANVASAAVPARLGYRLERVDAVTPQAPSETGRHLVFAVDAETWFSSST